MLRVVAISALLTGLVPGVARGASWHRPVSGRIVGTFSFAPAAPYAAGQRRGIVLAGRPGTTVTAACGGRVAFAGEVGRAGPTLSVQCGALRATYQGIADIEVVRGEVVLPGAPLARVGPAGALRLGAREGARAYLDPATLLADPHPPLGPAPRAPRPWTARRAPPGPLPARRAPLPRRPEPAPATSPALAPAPRAQPHDAPLLAWLGLAVLAAGLPAGGMVRGVRRRRRRTARAAPPAARTAAI